MWHLLFVSALFTRITAETCVDKADCSGYGPGVCQGGFQAWAMVNCRQTCKFCQTATGQPCKDFDVDCAEYDTTWCSDPKYEAWAIYKCPQHCSKCNVADLQSKPLTLCQDNVDCRLYGQTACGGTHQVWAQQHCPEYCGFCEGINRPPKSCVDAIPNCGQYTSICRNQSFAIWVDDNCKKTCGLCPVKDDADIMLR